MSNREWYNLFTTFINGQTINGQKNTVQFNCASQWTYQNNTYTSQNCRIDIVHHIESHRYEIWMFSPDYDNITPFFYRCFPDTVNSIDTSQFPMIIQQD